MSRLGPTTNEINFMLRRLVVAPGLHKQKLEQMYKKRRAMLVSLHPHMRMRNMRITDKEKLKKDPSKRTQPIYYKGAAIRAAWKARQQALKSGNPLLVNPADIGFMRLDILEKVIEAYETLLVKVLAKVRARQQSARE